MKLPGLRQFKQYWVNNEHDDENGTDFTNKKRIQGIYVLYADETIVYIGMSTHLWQRFKQQKLAPREVIFTSFAFYEFEGITKKQLQIYEALYIEHYKPMWNKVAGKRLIKEANSVIFS